MSGMRSVIGGNGIDRTVGDRDQYGFTIGRRAQRRIHLVIAVIVAHVLVRQCEMMRRDFASDAHFRALAAAHTLQRVRCRKMSHVQAGIGNVHGKLHVAHLSTADALKSVRRGKRAKARVTCEVTPHHFTLTDDDMRDYDSNYKMNPPLRSASDREAILAALADGTVDAIATDHAPHASHEKEMEFERAAFGITGLETALALALTKLHREERIPLVRIVELFSSGPARCFDVPGRGSLARGSIADVTVFDPKKKWTFEAAKSRSKSRNTPFDGWNLTGKVVATIVGGKIVYAS